MPIERIQRWIQISQKYTRITWQRNFVLMDERDKPKMIFVMIPGNPGNDRFYDHFGQRIIEVMGDNQFKIPTEFYTISHLNHVQLPERLKYQSDIKPNGKFSLMLMIKKMISSWIRMRSAKLC